MNTFQQARERGDTRGMHHAYKSLRRDLHEALAKFEYGKYSRRAKRLVKMMERGSGV
tara:strand:- start:563 stop:733 length:171 start_codon:yes stop_codon:yes gene_type:complete